MWRDEVTQRDFIRFHNRCQSQSVSDYALTVISDHLLMLITDFSEVWKFTNHELSWLDDTTVLVFTSRDCSGWKRWSGGFADFDVAAQTIYRSKGQSKWCNEQTAERYPDLTAKGKKLLLLFPTSYLVKCGFSAIVDFSQKSAIILIYAEEGTCVWSWRT